MGRTFIHFVLLSIILVVVQVVFCNKICLFNVAIPIVFIYAILHLPITLHTNWVMTIAFLLGLSVDVFSDTLGINSLSCTIIAFARGTVLKLYITRGGDIPEEEPSTRSMGTGAYYKYLLTMVLIYCILAFVLESFTFFNPLRLCSRILASTLLSFAVIWGIDCLTTNRRREKRL